MIKDFQIISKLGKNIIILSIRRGGLQCCI